MMELRQRVMLILDLLDLQVYATWFSPNRKLRSHEAGDVTRQLGEDGDARTIVRLAKRGRTP